MDTKLNIAWKLFTDRATMAQFDAALEPLTMQELQWMQDQAPIFFSEEGADRDGSVAAWEEYELAVSHAIEAKQFAK